ncbi:MAG: GNAT family N-acetyltransferase [Armatimonadetes bacterium]|nr:GNAT family N-acetyltransferase [Armatimonadota bacterium]
MGLGWDGELIRLVPLDFERHFENCYRWINDEEVNRWLCAGDFPMTRLGEREWFEKAQQPSDSTVHFAIETLDGKHVGQSGIHQINFRHGTALTGSFIGDPDERGKGYGTDAAKVRAWYAFHILGLRMLYSEYFAGNDLSRRMQEKTGYREYGVRPKAIWKQGEYRDLVLTYFSREDWKASQ